MSRKSISDHVEFLPLVWKIREAVMVDPEVVQFCHRRGCDHAGIPYETSTEGFEQLEQTHQHSLYWDGYVRAQVQIMLRVVTELN